MPVYLRKEEKENVSKIEIWKMRKRIRKFWNERDEIICKTSGNEAETIEH